MIIMGETGCGKTRLIRFMCELQAGPQRHKNILLMKVDFLNFFFIFLFRFFHKLLSLVFPLHGQKFLLS